MDLIRSWNGQKIRIRESDRYVCVADIAKASGKKLNDWKRNEESTAYLEALSGATGIPVAELLQVKNGRPTFAHPKVSLRFAQWCSPELAVQVDIWIDELLTTGSVSLVREVKEPQLPKNYLEALKALVTSEEEKLLLEAKIEEDRPKVEYAEAIAFSDSSVSFATYAKMLGGVGRNKLMAKLREIGILMKGSTLPYQKFIDCGWFEVGQELREDGRVYVYARITGKGQIAIKRRIDRYYQLEQQTVNAIVKAVGG